MGLLKPVVGGRIRAIRWKNIDARLDELGIIPSVRGIQFVKRDGVNSLRCRRCRGLKYASQSEASHWRAQRKALSIRRRVSTSSDTLDGPFPPKPPKIRWATYKRLRAVDAALQEQWLFGAAGDLGRLHSRVKRR